MGPSGHQKPNSWHKIRYNSHPPALLIPCQSRYGHGVPRETFRCSQRVTYSDCTLGNHVYYARYLDLLEWARGEFFRHLEEPFLKWQQADAIFPVIECRVRYRNAARYDDLLT